MELHHRDLAGSPQSVTRYSLTWLARVFRSMSAWMPLGEG